MKTHYDVHFKLYRQKRGEFGPVRNMLESSSFQLISVSVDRPDKDIANLMKEAAVHDELRVDSEECSSDSDEGGSSSGSSSDSNDGGDSSDSESASSADFMAYHSDQESDSQDLLNTFNALHEKTPTKGITALRNNMVCDKPSSCTPNRVVGVSFEDLLFFIDPSIAASSLPLRAREFKNNSLVQAAAASCNLSLDRIAVPCCKDDNDILARGIDREQLRVSDRLRERVVPVHLLPFLLFGAPVKYADSFKSLNTFSITLMRLITSMNQELSRRPRDILFKRQLKQLKQNTSRTISLCERSNDTVADYDQGISRLTSIMENMSNAFATLENISREKIPQPCAACSHSQKHLADLAEKNKHLERRCQSLEMRLCALEKTTAIDDASKRPTKRRRRR